MGGERRSPNRMCWSACAIAGRCPDRANRKQHDGRACRILVRRQKLLTWPEWTPIGRYSQQRRRCSASALRQQGNCQNSFCLAFNAWICSGDARTLTDSTGQTLFRYSEKFSVLKNQNAPALGRLGLAAKKGGNALCPGYVCPPAGQFSILGQLQCCPIRASRRAVFEHCRYCRKVCAVSGRKTRRRVHSDRER